MHIQTSSVLRTFQRISIDSIKGSAPRWLQFPQSASHRYWGIFRAFKRKMRRASDCNTAIAALWKRRQACCGDTLEQFMCVTFLTWIRRPWTFFWLHRLAEPLNQDEREDYTDLEYNRHIANRSARLYKFCILKGAHFQTFCCSIGSRS